MSRRVSREIAMKLVFQMSINKEEINEVLENFKENCEENQENIEYDYVSDLVKGTYDNIEEIDKTIEDNLRNWKLDRIPKIDLAILRLSVFELKFYENTPEKVAINEAIELSKKYCDEKSWSFINAVLDNILKK